MMLSGLSITVSQPRGDPTHKGDNNQDPITRGESQKPTKETFLEHSAQEIKETTPLDTTGHVRPPHKAWES